MDIPNTTILQNRYCIVKTIGQGGFGRTYLAQDRDRFNELCVLKEYSPAQMGTYAMEKSKELFEREAQVLYQLDHPQIPKFRASFADKKRLFLVQDYVEGKTYSDLLKERLKNYKAFTEAEVIQLMQQMLPILEHIHSKGIIHRDISPDNIILRNSDKLPVLIDFGVVKQGVDESGQIARATTVGKVGYSPSEQLQTGQVFPNSDLYALAVSCVVLMTGKKPQNLFDQNTMTWQWYQWLPALTPWFGNLLNRMMSLRPNNRFQSATEVLQQLRAFSGLIPTVEDEKTALENSEDPTFINQQQVVNQTVSYTPKSTVQNRFVTPVKTPKKPLLNSYWTLMLITGGLIALVLSLPAIIITYLIPNKPISINSKNFKFSSDNNKENTSEVITNPNSAPPPNSTPITPTQSNNSPPPSLPPQQEVLVIQVGQTIAKQGTIKPGQSMIYVLPGSPGQKLNSMVTQGQVRMTLLAPNRQLINGQAKDVNQWQGDLSMYGDYYIEVNSYVQNADVNYTINFTLNQGQ
jgi:serine/threonine protein kinase